MKCNWLTYDFKFLNTYFFSLFFGQSNTNGVTFCLDIVLPRDNVLHGQVISKSNEKTSSKSLHQILPMIRTEVVPGLQISTEKMKGELEIAAT